MSELDEQIANRRAKRQRLAEAGLAVYPHRFDWDVEPAEAHRRFGERSAEDLEAAPLRLRVPGRVSGGPPAARPRRFGERSAEDLEAAPLRLRVPGRVSGIREHGKSAFLDLH